MYTIQEVIQNLDTRLALILLAGAIMFTGAYTYYISAILIGRREKTHAIPLFANMYFFAHDMGYIILFQRWFGGEVDHWFFKAMWFGLIAFNVLELIVMVQTFKYSRAELFPSLSKQQYLGVLVVMQIGIGLIFWWVYSLFEDPLFLSHFAITVVIANICGIPLLLRRENQKGVSVTIHIGLIIMTAGFFFGYLPNMADGYNSLSNYAIGLVAIGANVFAILWLRRAKTLPEKLVAVV